jgi:hypothetical protein
VAMGEPPCSVAATTESQHAATATTAVTTVGATAPSALLAPALADDNQVEVVDVPDDDVPPPRWGKWESLSTPAPEPPVGCL